MFVVAFVIYIVYWNSFDWNSFDCFDHDALGALPDPLSRWSGLALEIGGLPCPASAAEA
jgi:hypothetical protein